MIRTLPIFALAAISACTMQQADNSQAHGAQLYAQHCVACHGSTGQGDGPIAAQLAVAPPDLTALSIANRGVFPADDVMAQIYGYHGRYVAGAMPEFGPVLDGPSVGYQTASGEVLATPQALIDLSLYLQSIQR